MTAPGTSKVVFQTSSNLSDWYKVESYNDAVTFTDATVYDGYASSMRTSGGAVFQHGDNGYYWSTPTGTTDRAYFFPRGDSSYNNPNTDTIVNALKEVRARTPGPTERSTRPTSASSC